MKNKTWLQIGAVATVLLLAGCDTFRERQSHHASSLFAYLYPNRTDHVDEPGIPVLSLPLRVGIAFVPEDQPRSQRYWTANGDLLGEEKRMELLKKVSDQFKKCPFVSSIETIPSPYLTPRGGFANLDQIKTMYGVDVMVLLAYDQVQFTDEGMLSLSYWTIVGAYVIQGEKNDTQTMMDAAVYDIASRKLLFRAPGIDRIHGSATPINLSEQLRRDSDAGFKNAATNMTVNLQVALDDFRDRVKAAPTEYKIIEKPGYTGGAAFGGVEVAAIGAMSLGWLWTRRHNSK